MKPHASIGAIAVAIAMMLTDVAWAAACARRDEMAALDARVLQSELMVAALVCGQRDTYNAVVRRYTPELAQYGDPLRRYFRRAEGERAAQALDSFVTGLANRASHRSNEDRPAFCGRTAALFDGLLNGAEEPFLAFAERRPFRDAHGVPACQLQVVASD